VPPAVGRTLFGARFLALALYHQRSVEDPVTVNAAPRLSIGLPIYNGETFLAESLEALLGQSYADFELIISDNASTDNSADICRRYAKQDSRIRYVRQPRNIGMVPNHNFVLGQATSELFKWASDDDLYARDLLRRCVDALDENPQVVLAHSVSAMIDKAGAVTGVFEYRTAVADSRPPERFRSMLFDGWDDYTYGVVRTKALRQIPVHNSYHFADRILNTAIALQGPFHVVPECLYFRREHPGRPALTVRSRCALMDPRRSSRLRHPLARLYAEYIWGYVAAIRRAPLSPDDRRECYRYLAQWIAGRAVPVAGRALRGGTLKAWEPTSAEHAVVSPDAVVARRDKRPA
jgi:glycosyltransferase involved in cell wall biosynthesis